LDPFVTRADYCVEYAAYLDFSQPIINHLTGPLPAESIAMANPPVDAVFEVLHLHDGVGVVRGGRVDDVAQLIDVPSDQRDGMAQLVSCVEVVDGARLGLDRNGFVGMPLGRRNVRFTAVTRAHVISLVISPHHIVTQTTGRLRLIGVQLPRTDDQVPFASDVAIDLYVAVV
jgi:hypothetical protein